MSNPPTLAAAAPLTLGELEVWPPVVLAPMAGVTNAPYRRMCRDFAVEGLGPDAPAGSDPGLYVGEMIGVRALVEGDDKTRRLATFPPEERPRSIQVYGTDPGTVADAVTWLIEVERADHIDLNFGCPAPKVTRLGGGAALPYRRHRFRQVVGAATGAAGRVPVTVKFRKGIDDQHLTFLDTGRIAEEEGAAGVALHARTAQQLYSGDADWRAIARLKEAVRTIPVLGNGDVWTASDATRMMQETGCDGVVIGRGCLGRPWLFADLARAFKGSPSLTEPPLDQVGSVMVDHVRRLIDWFGERHGITGFRKHASWYLRGYPVGPDLRQRFSLISGLDELESLVGTLDAETLPHPGMASQPRGHTYGPRKVRLPHRYLDGGWDLPASPGSDLAVGGG